MRPKRIIPAVLFLIAVLLSAWFSPALGSGRETPGSRVAVNASSSVIPGRSSTPGGELKPEQIALLQSITGVLLSEEDVQLFLPLVRR